MTVGFWLHVGRRLLEAALMLGLSVLVVFAMTRLLPGDPIAAMIDGRNADPDFLQRLRHGQGIDQSFWSQFASYVTSLLRGDLGMSWRFSGTPVAALVVEAAPVTLLLLAGTVIVGFPLGVAAGVLSVYRRGTWVDDAITLGSVLAYSLPSIALATWLMLSASTLWNLSPSGGLNRAATLIAPVIILSLLPIGGFTRTTRGQILDILNQDFVRSARAKGLSEMMVLIRHALPNTLAALLTLVGTMAGTILTSTAVVETVFNLPGMGRLGVTAVLSRDYPLAGAVILFFVMAQVMISLVVDLATATIDPRSRDAMEGS